MTDNPDQTGGPVPPKLDLRKMGVFRGSDATLGTVKKVPAAGSEDKTVTLKPTTQLSSPPVGPAPAGVPPMSETVPIAAPPEPYVPTAPKSMPTGSQPQTIHIKIPKSPTVQSERTQPLVAQPEPKKKETSKIPLAAAQQSPTITAAPSTEAPKTIRIKPKAATVSAQRVAPQPAPAPAPAVQQPMAAEGPAVAPGEMKKKTSRISLEAALIADAEQEKLMAARSPKTIRLQRPAPTAATVKMAPEPGAPATIEPTVHKPTDREPMLATVASIEETSQIEAPPAPPEEGAMDTRRKTIRVKRPTQRPGIMGPSMESARGAVPLGAPQLVQQPMIKADEPSLAWSIVAIITMLVLLTTIYMLCAQAFGPNACLTEYSYYKDGPDLGWPGKLPIVRQN